MNTLRYPLLLIAGLVLVFTGCAKPAPEYTTYIKPEVDFSQFKSYKWADDKPESAMMQARRDIVHRFIVQTTEEELAADGLERSDRADLTVDYRITVSPQKSFWQTFFGAESVTPGSYNLRSAEAQASSVDERKWEQGVLVLEMSNSEGAVVWAGRASAIISRDQPGKVVSAVRAIMADYPPIL